MSDTIKKIIAVMLILIIAVGATGGVFYCTKNLDDPANCLGKKNTYTIVSENDKYSTSYQDGVWCKISDGIVKMVQYGITVEDREKTIFEILSEQDEFNLSEATIEAMDNEGNIIDFDLSTKFSMLDVGELYVSYKLSNGGGVSYLIYPDYLITVSKYLYYSDLENDETSTEYTTTE